MDDMAPRRPLGELDAAMNGSLRTPVRGQGEGACAATGVSVDDVLAHVDEILGVPDPFTTPPGCSVRGSPVSAASGAPTSPSSCCSGGGRRADHARSEEGLARRRAQERERSQRRRQHAAFHLPRFTSTGSRSH